MRWFYDKQLPRYLKASPESAFTEDQGRDEEAWLLEYLGSSLRTERGTDLSRIAAVTGRTLALIPMIEQGLTAEHLTLDQAKQRVTLSPQEWFREQSWCLAVFDALRV